MRHLEAKVLNKLDKISHNLIQLRGRPYRPVMDTCRHLELSLLRNLTKKIN